MKLSIFIVVMLFCRASSTELVGRDAVEAYLRGDISSSDKPKAAATDPSLDCGMRRLFLEKARAALAWRSDEDNQVIEEALEIKTRCAQLDGDALTKEGDNWSHTSSQRKLIQRANVQQEHQNPPFTVFVCPKVGRDDTSTSGNELHPFRTLHRALEATRSQGTAMDKEIVLKPGVHFLKKPIVLTPKDSNLIIKSADGDSNGTWLSGGSLIESRAAKWLPTLKHPHIWVAHNVSALTHDITGLFTIHPHTRLTLARFPNANVEEWDARNRYGTINSTAGDEWIFPPQAGVPDFTFLDLADPSNPTGYTKDDSAMGPYNQYGTGKGGACATVWGDLPSYWCSNVSAGGWANVDQAAAKAGRLNLPAGLHLASSKDSKSFQQRIQTLWKHNPQGAIFHISHSQGWAWHMFNVSHIDENDNDATTIHFDKGGSQGGRNWECMDKDNHMTHCDGPDKKLHGGPWYVEGILEELDAPGEFYWDADAKKLYLYPDCGNAEDFEGPCLPPDLIATNLKTLIKVQGTQQDPVRNVKLQGIGFRDAAKTYMTEQWAAPSGGDWSLHRGGAVHLEGTENVTVSDCQFQRLDGNAIMLGGYNRYAHVEKSEFNWLGEGAMATWGDTEGYDATGGAQPRFSLIENNMMANLGLYEKQSSAWGQSKACQNTIRNNVMFNLPRAAINFNDGLGGGNLVDGNIIFNSCRESGDHGPINSWDRMPFLTETTGSPSFAALPTHTQHNMILANYGASQGFDNDDGSSFYYTHDNVFYQADGFKMDYGGHSSQFTHNLVYSDDKGCYGTGSFKKGFADVLSNNTFLVAKTKDDAPTLGHLFQCSLEDGMIPCSNRYYTVTGNGTFACGNEDKLSLAAMQEKGFEAGSTLEAMPSADTILKWAKEILDSASSSSQ